MPVVGFAVDATSCVTTTIMLIIFVSVKTGSHHTLDPLLDLRIFLVIFFLVIFLSPGSVCSHHPCVHPTAAKREWPYLPPNIMHRWSHQRPQCRTVSGNPGTCLPGWRSGGDGETNNNTFEKKKKMCENPADWWLFHSMGDDEWTNLRGERVELHFSPRISKNGISAAQQ